MKTCVELNKEKVELAKSLTSVTVMRELLDKALDAYIAKARRNSLLSMLGTEFFEGDVQVMRKQRGSISR